MTRPHSVSRALARAVVRYRTETGPFQQVEDLLAV